MKLFLPIILLSMNMASASIGDNLPEFTSCYEDCNDVTCRTNDPSPKYLKDSVNVISRNLFLWDCPSDCKYKCQQDVTKTRQASGFRMEQFYGKWPFTRVLGITELFSTVFSMGNFYVNFINFKKISFQYRSSMISSPEKATMYSQYILLLMVSLFGWTCSSIFHIRDFPVTETLDYLGAGLIGVAQFNAIFVRFFGLFREDRKRLRRFFQMILCVALICHYIRLYINWDYTYNMRFNVFFGLSSAVLWIWHSLRVNRLYKEKEHIYSNSIYLLPHETRILAKLNYVGLSRSKYIPYIPAILNIYLLSAVSLEMVDFEPWFSLIDAHSIWHLCTIFPILIWYDWNIWDMEFQSRLSKN